MLRTFFRELSMTEHVLSDSGIHVEPFEDIAEITMRWPRGGSILAADVGHAIDQLIDHMTDHGEWLPIIAFSEAPDTGVVVRAVLPERSTIWSGRANRRAS